VPARGKASPDSRRKIIAFDDATWHALHAFVRESGLDLQELADEAFRDLLKKHGRPLNLREALRQSTRRQPANDGGPRRRGR
jgi:hypothetical protein